MTAPDRASASASTPEPQQALYIGRFQPPHHAHVASALAALEHAPRLTLGLGSANLARSIKNPWTPQERAELWQLALTEAGIDVERVRFCPLPDRFDAERWAADVRGLFAPGEKVLLVGYEKDDSSAYLHWFPGWTRLVLPELEGGISATELRRAYFLEGPHSPLLAQHLPAATLPWLQRWAQAPDYARLQAEWAAVAAAQAAAPGDSRREQLWLWQAGADIHLRVRHDPIGDGLWELPGVGLPAGNAGVGTLYSGGGRTLTGETLSWVEQAAPPAELRGDLLRVPLAEALANPRQFYADHAVILEKLLG
ncbi:adenylyltransferase/cytidyltransferase family protein [Deinococcus sp. Marseille-Q6407]|uniref:adenylyltransferase/cytidyltransferase family protein n=1 Tax=Deinococcus sp. Marseille-Q6407 TaxID=2969223 RepID=UPI0021BE257E|nr:adenylyltransferase/cytidyltransferase family protein [Deinococcus sp. Marseille-Q6407]